jgi:hypothetical protein
MQRPFPNGKSVRSCNGYVTAVAAGQSQRFYCWSTLELTYNSTRISFKLMRGGKGQGGKAKLTATENKQSEINGLYR